MKKKVLISTLVLVIILTQSNYAQDTLKANYYNFLTELNVNLFQGELTLNNALKQIKFRYMTSETFALRLGFTVDSKHDVHNSNIIYGTIPSKNEANMSSTLIGINFGFEKHFKGTKRLSPYMGAELTLGQKWSKYKLATDDYTFEIKGSWTETQSVQSGNNYYYTTNYPERAFFSFGLNVVTGFDFYMAKHLFIGYELEFGFNNVKYKNIDITRKANPGVTLSEYTTPDLKDSEFSFGPKIINGIRIGYVF